MRIVWLVMLLPMWLPAAAGSDMLDAVNRVRQHAGLPILQRSVLLDRAAALHAGYLDTHRDPANPPGGVSAHQQRRGAAGFSGATPGERATMAGYPHRKVLENVSMGYPRLADAMDGLMSAIYHRLTFLDLTADELGAATGQRSRVFLLGRRDLGRVCRTPPAGAVFRTPVDCMGAPMTRAAYVRMCTDLPLSALYRASHPVACPNGQRLDADFMAGICGSPPAWAQARTGDRYYLPCGDGTRIDAGWLDGLCAAPPESARARGTGRYVELCQPVRRVDAEWFEDHCSRLPPEDRYRESFRYRQPCASNLELRAEFLDEMNDTVLDQRPPFVVWPPDGTTGVAPAFFIEDPDPLPDRAVSGNPISLQVNPARFDTVQLVDFTLSRLDAAVRVPVEARLLDAKRDPNALLTSHEFALFPIERLDWGARYEASVAVSLDGEVRHMAWQFTTRGGAVPILTVTAGHQRFEVRSGEPVWIYLPPQPDRPHTVLNSRTRFQRGSQVQLSVVDPNTAEITVEGRRCDRVTVEFDSGYIVELAIAGCRS